METEDDIVKEFLVESYENLDRLDQDLLALEEAPDNRDKLSSVFRAIHTIKGTSGFLAFNKLEHVTHVGESLLVLLRDGKMRLNGVIANGLLAMVDAVRKIMANIEAGQGEGDADYADLVATLERLQVTGGVETAETIHEETEAQRVSEVLETIAAQVAEDIERDTVAVAVAAPAKRAKSTKRRKKSGGNDDTVVAQHATSIVERDSASPSVLSPIQRGGDPAPLVNKANSSVPTSDNSDSADKSPAQSSVSDSSVRIDVSLLDKLMNLVGELVLARNQILQYSRSTEDATITAASQRLNLITTELQEGVMKTRMQPIQNAWNKLPRVVRDLSAQLGKHIQVKMEGADTELDKTILEAIKDPLTHIVRNSVDHGIEASDVRVANGKPAEGTLWLRAFHEGGQVNIEISDDGGGINLERVKQKALSQGMINPEQAAGMTERELTNLILLPGFSTAATVTNVSGRGVGMDVVKTNVERIGGTLDIHSVLGKGTTLRIKIPLTLAIVPALTVVCGGNRFCIPQVNLLELVRLDGDRVHNEIELIHSVPVYRLRGQLLPLLYLDEELRLRPRRSHEERQAEECTHIVVLQAEDRAFGLVVNSITDTQEIVVKPLGQHLKGVKAYAGATIMGDGTVSLILDVIGLAQQGRVLNEHRDHSNGNATSLTAARTDRQSWLVVDPGDGSQAAIDLGTVARLEEFQLSTVERSGHDEVVQYRDHILPLLRISTGYQQTSYSNDDSFGTKAKDSMSVVVYQHHGRQVGIVVGQIVDIVEHTLRVDEAVDSSSVVPPSQIINGRVTQIIDLGSLVASAM